MPDLPRRIWLALCASLAIHGVVLFSLFHILPSVPTESSKENVVVDRRIDAPIEYAPISISFDDLPAKPVLPAKRISASDPVIADHVPIAPTKELGADPRSIVQVGAQAPAATAAGSQVEQKSDSGAAGAAPLHGRLAKPDSSIVYVLDRSGSMGQRGKLARAVAHLKSSLEQLAPDVSFQIVTYDSQAAVFRIGGSPELIAATQANIAEAQSQLQQLVAEGSSRHFEGLRTGLGLQPDLLVLITDADELTPGDVKLLRKWNSRGTVIHAVLLGAETGMGASLLRELAGDGHVHYLPALDPASFRP